MIIIVSENDKKFEDKKQAVTELAFCHYPVTVQIGEEVKTFASFDAAREFVESK